MGLLTRLFGRTADGRYPTGTIPAERHGPATGGDRDSTPAPAYDPGADDWGGAPRPARSRRRLRWIALYPPLLVALVLAALRADLPRSRRPLPDVADPNAGVAAEPERTLVSQGVRFTLIGHRPLAKAVCARVPSCVTAASAHWAVTGTDLEAKTWMFVFADDADADAAVTAIVADFDLMGEPRPLGWAATGSSPGRFLVVVRVGRPGGGDVTADPVATEAADALRIHNTHPAVFEIFQKD